MVQRSKCPTAQNIRAMGNNIIAEGCPPLEVMRIAQAIALTIAQTMWRIRNSMAADIRPHFNPYRRK
jgi:hypothetical protein